MLKQGKPYHCFCLAEAIDESKRAVERGGAVWKYDRTCLGLDPKESRRRREAKEPGCLRIRVPDGETVYDDLVHGTTSFNNADIEDLVLLRTDGSPTYNLSCVSDAIAMRVSHVIRG